MDIYFDDNFGKLYECIEHGKAVVYNFSCEYGKIKHQFIRRSIDDVYSDLVTPYGYGGPLILEASDREKLLTAFAENFKQYCLENNIVSEFVRFHPLINNALDFTQIYNCELIRHTLGTDLTAHDDPTQGAFSKSCRKNIKKALKNGVSFVVTPQPQNLDRFIDIYYATMDRNTASDYYYFPKTYFEDCLKWFQKDLLLIEAVYEEQTIAAGMYFARDGVVHIHLSGTLSEFLYLSPAYILRYAAVLWAKEHHFRIVYHGGGKSNSPEDSLYLFKRQFSDKEYDFYVGKKIWNQSVYDQLCAEKNIDSNSDFFPAYRKLL